MHSADISPKMTSLPYDRLQDEEEQGTSHQKPFHDIDIDEQEIYPSQFSRLREHTPRVSAVQYSEQWSYEMLMQTTVAQYKSLGSRRQHSRRLRHLLRLQTYTQSEHRQLPLTIISIQHRPKHNHKPLQNLQSLHALRRQRPLRTSPPIPHPPRRPLGLPDQNLASRRRLRLLEQTHFPHVAGHERIGQTGKGKDGMVDVG